MALSSLPELRRRYLPKRVVLKLFFFLSAQDPLSPEGL